MTKLTQPDLVAALRKKTRRPETDGKKRRRDKMDVDRSFIRAGTDAGHCTARDDREIGIGADGPFGKNHKDEDCGCCDCTGCRFGAPRHRECRKHDERKHRHR